MMSERMIKEEKESEGRMIKEEKESEGEEGGGVLPTSVMPHSSSTERKNYCQMSYKFSIGIICTLLGSALPTGYSLGVMNMPQQAIRHWISVSLLREYEVFLSTSQDYILWGLVVSIYVGGALIGSTTGAFLANSLGRCQSLFLVHLLFMTSGFIVLSCHFVNIVELLLLGRLMAGLAAGAANSLVPLYLSEIAPPSMRGVMGTLFPLGLCSGIIISQVLGLPALLGKESTWALLVGGHFVFATCAIFLHPLMPLSPTYLYLIRKDPSAAHKALWHLRSGNIYAIDSEEKYLGSVALDKEIHAGRRGVIKLFTDKRLFRSLLCVVVLNAGQQLVGINAVFFYSTLVFTNAGLSLQESQAASLGAGVANLLMAASAFPLAKYCRRRVLLLTSICLYCFWQIVLTLSLYYVSSYPWTGWVAFVALFALVLTYGFGLGPVPYVLGTEIFPSEVRGVGLAMGSASNWGANLLVGLIFPILQERIGIFTFTVFISMCVFLFIFSYWVVPETFKPKENLKCNNGHENKPASSFYVNSPLLSTSSNSSSSESSSVKSGSIETTECEDSVNC